MHESAAHRLTSLMRVRVGDPALVPDLVTHLRQQIDVVVEVVSDDELEVSLLGSYEVNAMRMELYLRLRAWEAACDATTAELG